MVFLSNVANRPGLVRLRSSRSNETPHRATAEVQYPTCSPRRPERHQSTATTCPPIPTLILVSCRAKRNSAPVLLRRVGPEGLHIARSDATGQTRSVQPNWPTLQGGPSAQGQKEKRSCPTKFKRRTPPGSWMRLIHSTMSVWCGQIVDRMADPPLTVALLPKASCMEPLNVPTMYPPDTGSM